MFGYVSHVIIPPYYLYIPFDPLKLSNHLAKVTGLVTAGISDHVGRRPVMVTCFQAVRPQKLILILWFPDFLFPCLTVCHKNHKKKGADFGSFFGLPFGSVSKPCTPGEHQK